MDIPDNLSIISWNMTRAGPLRCAHCNIEAGERDAPDVLSTSEAFGVIDQIHETGTPVVM